MIFALSFFFPASGGELDMTSPFYKLSSHEGSDVSRNPEKNMQLGLSSPVQTSLKTSLVSSLLFIPLGFFSSPSLRSFND